MTSQFMTRSLLACLTISSSLIAPAAFAQVDLGAFEDALKAVSYTHLTLPTIYSV